MKRFVCGTDTRVGSWRSSGWKVVTVRVTLPWHFRRTVCCAVLPATASATTTRAAAVRLLTSHLSHVSNRLQSHAFDLRQIYRRKLSELAVLDDVNELDIRGTNPAEPKPPSPDPPPKTPLPPPKPQSPPCWPNALSKRSNHRRCCSISILRRWRPTTWMIPLKGSLPAEVSTASPRGIAPYLAISRKGDLPPCFLMAAETL